MNRLVLSVFALFLQCSTANLDLGPTLIDGVPVYKLDSESSIASNDEEEWIAVLKGDSSDGEVSSLCSGLGRACSAEGKPSQGGLGFVTFHATRTEMQLMVTTNSKFLEFVERSTLVYLPPNETALPGDGGADFANDVGILAGGYFIITCCPASISPIITTYQYAESEWNKASGTHVAMVGLNSGEFRAQKCRGDCNGQPQNGEMAALYNCMMGTGACPPDPDNPEGPPPRTISETTLWGLDRIDDRWAKDKTYGYSLDGEGVHVYVVDTGIRTTHKEFEGRAIPTIETGSGQVVVCDPGDSSCASDNEQGHGTHCAGTVGGRTVGVAKKVTLHAVKVFAKSATATSKIVLGVDWVARNAFKPAVISMSLGSQGSSVAMKRVVKKAADAGIAVIVAGGNDRGDACKQTPAMIPTAITVCSSNTKDAISSFSNHGTCTDIFAPGDNIESAGYKSDTELATMSGTSMSTPHVAGAAAMMLQVRPQMMPYELEKALQHYATKGKLPDAKKSPNLILYVTKYEDSVLRSFSTTTTTLPTPAPPTPPPTPPPPPSARRRRGSRRRKSSSRRRRRRRRRRKSR